MREQKSAVIEAVCAALDAANTTAASAAAAEYQFTLTAQSGRCYSALDATRVFVRDGFIDRYSGARLVNPAVLRILSKEMPAEFRFQKNWRMNATHPAYWELVPTIDHLDPLARGGKDSADNWMTTSMLRNSAKSNWTIQELGWKVLPAGDIAAWDGLTGWLIGRVEKRAGQTFEPYVMRWYRAAKMALGLGAGKAADETVRRSLTNETR